MFGIGNGSLAVTWLASTRLGFQLPYTYTRGDATTFDLAFDNSYGSIFLYVIDQANPSRFFHVGETEDTKNPFRITYVDGSNNIIIERVDGLPVFDNDAQPATLDVYVGFEVQSQYTPSIYYIRDNNGHAVMTGRTQVTSYLLDTNRTKRLCVEADNANGRGTGSRTFKYNLGDTDVSNLVYSYFTPIASDTVASVIEGSGVQIPLYGSDQENLP